MFKKPLHLVNSGASPDDVREFFRAIGSQSASESVVLGGLNATFIGATQVTVYPGAGITADGYFVSMSTSETVSVATHAGGPPRWDLLVVVVDDTSFGASADRARLAVVSGGYSSAPSYPTAPAHSMLLAGLQVNGWGDVTVHDGRLRKVSGYNGQQTKYAPGLGGIVTYDQNDSADGRMQFNPANGKITFNPPDGSAAVTVYPQIGDQTVQAYQLDTTTLWNPLWAGWRDYTPIWTNLPRSHWSRGQYRVQGYTVDFQACATMSSAVESPAPTVAPFFTLPVPCQTGERIFWSGAVAVLDNTDPPTFCSGVWTTISGTQGRIVGATPLQDQLYGVLSADIGANGEIIVNGRYRRASATAGSLA